MRYLITLILGLSMFDASAALRVERRDMKLASQALLETQTYSAPVAQDDDRVLTDEATSNSATTTITTFDAQPDVCRTLSVTPTGTTDDVSHGSVVVTGTNGNGESITESFDFAANANTKINGTKAFCSVTSVLFPIQDGASATFDVGVNETLGLKRCLDASGDIAWFTFNGEFEATRPTISVDATVVELNLLSGWNQAPDGSSDIELYFVQNFRCLP